MYSLLYEMFYEIKNLNKLRFVMFIRVTALNKNFELTKTVNVFNFF